MSKPLSSINHIYSNNAANYTFNALKCLEIPSKPGELNNLKILIGLLMFNQDSKG